MSAGTLTLNNNSASVAGTDTTFTTELAAGDFIVVVVGGVPFTLPVLEVNSNTRLTLVSNYTGPRATGAAWSAVPRVALNMVTAAMVVQNTQALLGLNYDKQNWQQFFTADGDVTITLPDTSQITGPSAKKLINSVSDKAKKGDNSDITSLTGLTTPLSMSQGGLGASTPKGGRQALGVDWYQGVANPGGGILRILNYDDSGLMTIVRRFPVSVPANSAGGWSYNWLDDVGESFVSYPGISVNGMAGESGSWSIGTEGVTSTSAAGFIFNKLSSATQIWITIILIGARA